MSAFPEFAKIPRLSREGTITEKLDGTNALIRIDEACEKLEIGSRTCWITPEDDNYSFAERGYSNKAELLKLGQATTMANGGEAGFRSAI